MAPGMKWAAKTDHLAIVLLPRHHRRHSRRGRALPARSRSALGWIIERYRVTTDKASGIVNDPNDWCDEHANPTYIVDLIKKVTTVSVETMKIVDGLAGG
ncbi:type ISP restriction/modification enzyme [Mycobacterium tuberculosis]|uniref:type ISP restriction/modification enzyme n=3 Tax=Mycobacterium tuberculosis TaxID=1773 RepID=UPI0006969212|nr:type ISP restriction/modification enzyme [Mycobacterium tuberculosis]UDT85039.1 hypothetical protein LDH19_10975 [Mycobacterium tuberculosis]